MKKKHIIIAVLSITIILGLWIVWGNTTVGVTHYEVTSDKLPISFDNYKIAVVSDVHNAEYGENNSRLIALIEKQEPDMIAITGDLVDSSKTDIEIAKNLVENLVEIAPCYYVTGNHEAWIGEEYQELEKILLDANVIILHDEYVEITQNNETIQIAGLDDPDFTDTDSFVQESILEMKLSDMNLSNNYCVLLSHRPETFGAYVSHDIDLVLSGHAHGGQFRLPFIGGLIAPNQGLLPEYDGGVYTENETTMIVSRGIGNSIIPIRFNNRPEIVMVTLTCG